MTDKTSILVAEDEAMLRIVVVEMLQDAGFDVFEAGDGVEALELLKANRNINLLISDVKMPRMDGYALVEAGLTVKPDLRVLLMTGYSQTPPPHMLNVQNVQILRKPFNIDRLCTLAAKLTA